MSTVFPVSPPNDGIELGSHVMVDVYRARESCDGRCVYVVVVVLTLNTITEMVLFSLLQKQKIY